MACTLSLWPLQPSQLPPKFRALILPQQFIASSASSAAPLSTFSTFMVPVSSATAPAYPTLSPTSPPKSPPSKDFNQVIPVDGSSSGTGSSRTASALTGLRCCLYRYRS